MHARAQHISRGAHLGMLAAGTNLATALALERGNQHLHAPVLGLTLASSVLAALAVCVALYTIGRHMVRRQPSRMSHVAAWSVGPAAYAGGSALTVIAPIGWLPASLFAALPVAILAAAEINREESLRFGPSLGYLAALLVWLVRAPAGTQETGVVLLILAILAMAGVATVPSVRVREKAVLILALVLLAAPWFTDVKLRAVDRPSRPSIVLITIDAWRADMLRPELTPNISRFASTATRYDSARTPAPWTRPAIASILTGVSPLVHQAGLLNERVPEETETLAEVLQAAGYRTVAFVRNVNLDPKYGFAQGFDEYYKYPLTLGKSWGDVLPRIARRMGVYPQRVTELLGRQPLSWLKRHGGGPFFLWIHYLDPHTPYSIPSGLRSGTPPAGLNFSWERSDPVELRRPIDSEEARWFRHVYETEVRFVDRELGPLLDYLSSEKRGLDHVVVITADHGEALWEQGGFGHGGMAEEVLRVPLILRPPGEAAARVAVPVTTGSVYATLLAAAGEEPDMTVVFPPLPAPGDGQSAPLANLATVNMYGGYYHVSLPDGPYRYLFNESSSQLTVSEIPQHPIGGVERHPLPDLDRAQALIDALFTNAAQLRDRLGIDTGNIARVDEDMLRDLRNLGYIQ